MFKAILVALIMAISASSAMAGDMECYIAGKFDALGVRDVKSIENPDGTMVDKLLVTLDNGKNVLVASDEEILEAIQTNKYWILISKKIVFPCQPGDIDYYTGWCGSKEQIKQYKDLGITEIPKSGSIDLSITPQEAAKLTK